MRLLTETPTHHPKNPVNSENSNHPTQGTRCNPDLKRPPAGSEALALAELAGWSARARPAMPVLRLAS
jgi:hypothetical protein